MRAKVWGSAPITAAQIKKIHALKNALSLDDDLYRVILQDNFQVGSCKALNCTQAGDLIETMKGKAVESGLWERRDGRRKKFDELIHRPGMATPEQLRKIEAQWREASRAAPAEQDKALRRFVERIAKVSALRFLDQEGAGKVLNALKAMQQRKNTKTAKRAKNDSKAFSWQGQGAASPKP